MNNEIEPATETSTERRSLQFDSEKKSNLPEKKINRKHLLNRINSVDNKKVFAKIFKIIHDDGDQYTIDENGVHFNLHNLQEHTSAKIERFLDSYDKMKTDKIITSDKWYNTLSANFDVDVNIIKNEKIIKNNVCSEDTKQFIKKLKKDTSENKSVTMFE